MLTVGGHSRNRTCGRRKPRGVVQPSGAATLRLPCGAPAGVLQLPAFLGHLKRLNARHDPQTLPKDAQSVVLRLA